MNKQILCFLLIIFTFTLKAQTILSDWVASVGTNGWDKVNGIATDTSGNVLILGSLGYIPSKENKQSFLSDNNFLAKYDSSGNLIWKKQLYSAGEGYLSQITITDQNLILITGSSIPAKSDGKKPVRIIKFFLQCLDPDGTVLWTQSFQGSKLDYFSTLSFNNSNGDTYLGGYFSDTLKADGKKFYSRGKSDAIFLRFDKEGNTRNILTFGGSGTDRIFSILPQDDGNILLLGKFQQKISIGKKSISIQHRQKSGLFAALLDKDLNCISLNLIAVGSGIEITSAVNHPEGISIAGNFSDEILFGAKKYDSRGSDDIFLVFLNNDLSFKNFQQMGSIRKDKCGGIIRKGKNIILSGSFAADLQIRDIPVIPRGSGADIFVASYSQEGNLNWFKHLGGESDDYPKGISDSRNNYIYLTGSYRDTLTIQSKKTGSLGAEDIFIARIQECEEEAPAFDDPEMICPDSQLTLDAGEGFLSYNWDNGKSTIQTYEISQQGTYPLCLTTKTGCILFDSVVVETAPDNTPFVGNDTSLCDTSFLVLRPLRKYKSYLWSNDSTDAFLIVNGSSLKEGSNLVWLKTIDENGCEGYDDIVIVMKKTYNVSEHNFLCQVSPNPTPGPLQISFTGFPVDLKVRLYNALGKEILRQNISEGIYHGTTVNIDIGNFSPGYYTMIISAKDHMFIKKILLQ